MHRLTFSPRSKLSLALFFQIGHISEISLKKETSSSKSVNLDETSAYSLSELDSRRRHRRLRNRIAEELSVLLCLDVKWSYFF
jgi:hypothetical protein